MRVYKDIDIEVLNGLNLLDLIAIKRLVLAEFERYKHVQIQDFTPNGVALRLTADECLSLLSIKRKLNKVIERL